MTELKPCRCAVDSEEWQRLADEAISLVESAVRETSWGQPTFGPDYGEELREKYGALLTRAALARVRGERLTMPNFAQAGEPAAPSGGIAELPEGFAMERDQDGDPVLIPPPGVTIFSEPGEGWLVTTDFMQRRDWANDGDVIAACCEYLQSIEGAL